MSLVNKSKTLRDYDSKGSLLCSPVAYLIDILSAEEIILDREPVDVDDWATKFMHTVQENDQCLLLLVSPPGAGKCISSRSLISVGKTHLAQCIMEINSNRHCRRFDCSSDELVERALDSILEENFPIQGDKSLLVADEFHMLSKAHKKELFQWVAPRLFWLKVILLANRSDGIARTHVLRN